MVSVPWVITTPVTAGSRSSDAVARATSCTWSRVIRNPPTRTTSLARTATSPGTFARATRSPPGSCAVAPRPGAERLAMVPPVASTVTSGTGRPPWSADDLDVEERRTDGAHHSQPERQVHLSTTRRRQVAEVQDVGVPEVPQQRDDRLLRLGVVPRHEDRVVPAGDPGRVDHHGRGHRVQRLDDAGGGEGAL